MNKILIIKKHKVNRQCINIVQNFLQNIKVQVIKKIAKKKKNTKNVVYVIKLWEETIHAFLAPLALLRM